MKTFLLLLTILLASFLSVKAQDALQDKETESIKRTVETYLFSEEDRERKQTLYPQTAILSTDPQQTKIEKTPISAKAGKKPKGAKIVSLQKISSIEVFENAAIVKVETDLSSGDVKIPKHYQFISLLKASGEWKIVSILMPSLKSQDE